VLTEYPNTPAIHDALLILVKGYDALGMSKLRDDAQRVLDMNFPKPGSRTDMRSEKSQ